MENHTRLQKNPAFQNLQEFITEPGSRDVLWHYQVGKLLMVLLPERQAHYGQGYLEQIAKALGDPALLFMLYSARLLATKYDRKAVKYLNSRLSWSHVRYLLTVRDDAKRQKLQEQCLREKWSVGVLRKYIRLQQGGMRPSRGRRLFCPADPTLAAGNLIDESEIWLRRFEQAWFGKDGTLAKPESREELFRKRRDLVKKAREALERIEEAARRGRRRLVLPRSHR